jgi:acyl-CoA dehydrogenase
VSDDFGLAHAYAMARTLRFADGPDEVHREQIARLELGEQLATLGNSDKAVGQSMAARG